MEACTGSRCKRKPWAFDRACLLFPQQVEVRFRAPCRRRSRPLRGGTSIVVHARVPELRKKLDRLQRLFPSVLRTSKLERRAFLYGRKDCFLSSSRMLRSSFLHFLCRFHRSIFRRFSMKTRPPSSCWMELLRRRTPWFVGSGLWHQHVYQKSRRPFGRRRAKASTHRLRLRFGDSANQMWLRTNRSTNFQNMHSPLEHRRPSHRHPCIFFSG